ncbi:MAG: hypothetical protein HQ551_13150 [Desulfobacteraceae bacterium]|nr:hypothetical protein [Desulfobacteraceae bacterium]
MKLENKIMLPIAINAVVTLVAVLLSGYISFTLAKNSELETRKYELNKAALSRVLESVIDYSNYSTVNWKEVDDLYYRPYNCDWGEKYDKYIDNSNSENNQTAVYGQVWHKLQNAKEDFKKKTTEARIIGSGKVVRAVKYVESGFDEVFFQIVSDGWYLRAFVDHYNEVMPERFNKLEESFREELIENME